MRHLRVPKQFHSFAVWWFICLFVIGDLFGGLGARTMYPFEAPASCETVSQFGGSYVFPSVVASSVVLEQGQCIRLRPLRVAKRFRSFAVWWFIYLSVRDGLVGGLGARITIVSSLLTKDRPISYRPITSGKGSSHRPITSGKGSSHRPIEHLS